MPGSEDAYIEACNQYAIESYRRKWSHAAVYAAAAKTGSMFLKSKTEKQAFPAFRKNYREFTERVMAGEKLQVPESERLEQKPERVCSKGENLKKLDDLKSMFS